MYDATRRRNYSPAGERFRKEHQRHRDWGLKQRHAKKLCDLYGSVEAAEAYFAQRAREALAPRSPEPAVQQVECPGPPVPPAGLTELPTPPVPSAEQVQPLASP